MITMQTLSSALEAEIKGAIFHTPIDYDYNKK